MKYKDRALRAEHKVSVLERLLDSKTYNEKYLKARIRELEEYLSPTN